ncbi:uncharacterized protein troap isoform X1 [Takifugu flavidus]|uniref:uncharacterized protein troap isoform X1 n=1 Tax=Takifugu flavidus TaxID=433684 RepID=UPI0025447AAF|nr:uncharacterized protein troap isoform X1 [Takifugu flavidus]
MDSSPVLRQQNQNKISHFLRMKNEQSKTNQPKSPKSAPHYSNQDENKDPQKSAVGKKASVRQGVSRLPVLAKSLHLPSPSSFSLSHCKWEEKPLAGKAKKEKPCTRPLPFNRSHCKNSRKAAEYEQPSSVLQSNPGSHSVQQSNAACCVTQKQSNGRANQSKYPHVSQNRADLTKRAEGSEGKVAENTSKCKGQRAAVTNLKPSAHLSHHVSSIPNNTCHQNNAASSAEACTHNMNQLSIKDLSATSHAQQSMQLTEQARSSTDIIISSGEYQQPSLFWISDKGESFKTDHAALLSILLNDGVSATGLGSKPYNDLPQRVSILKNKQKAGPNVGFMKSEPFSPDPTALQSILQNEGLKAGGCLGATPKNAIRPSGRGTSVYTAQRVPARKQQVEATRATAEPVGLKWTPQRVPNTRHQPMSAMKWHLSTQPSPYCVTPGLRSCKTNRMPHQEEIVQRLFDDQEEESTTNVTEKAPEKPVQDPANTSHKEEKGETCSADGCEQQRTVGAQPFIQAPQRASVIFFSTGKKLLRVPRFERQEDWTLQEQDCAGPTQARQLLPAKEETREESGPTSRPAAAQTLHKDSIVQKSCVVSSAVAMLRKRLPPLEELRLDEEVATYTSVLAATGFLPPQPRCGNPLAAMLHFEESSRFVPIDLDPASDPTWPCSLMEER